MLPKKCLLLVRSPSIRALSPPTWTSRRRRKHRVGDRVHLHRLRTAAKIVSFNLRSVCRPSPGYKIWSFGFTVNCIGVWRDAFSIREINFAGHANRPRVKPYWLKSLRSTVTYIDPPAHLPLPLAALSVQPNFVSLPETERHSRARTFFVRLINFPNRRRYSETRDEPVPPVPVAIDALWHWEPPEKRRTRSTEVL